MLNTFSKKMLTVDPSYQLYFKISRYLSYFIKNPV